MPFHIGSSSFSPVATESNPGRGRRVGQHRDERPERNAGPSATRDTVGSAPARAPTLAPSESTGLVGVRADYRSGEEAALKVRTEDGDTVTISFAALNRIRAGSYAAQADGETASAETVSTRSSLNVNVKVDGTLDDEEVKQIGDLLEKLVSTARSDALPTANDTTGFGELDSFAFAYKAYERVQVSALEAQAN